MLLIHFPSCKIIDDKDQGDTSSQETMDCAQLEEGETSPFDTIRKFLRMTEQAAVQGAFEYEDTGEYSDQFTNYELDGISLGRARERAAHISFDCIILRPGSSVSGILD
jgi:hypothetical protein